MNMDKKVKGKFMGVKSSDYSEDALVEQPAIALLAKLGWETFNAYGEFDNGASPLGRETKAEVVLKTRLRDVLLRLNSDVPSAGSFVCSNERLTAA